MITIDQLEILLRSIPQYFLFGGLAVLLYSWIEKKPKIGIWGEALFAIIGLTGFVVMLSGMIPSPMAEGVVAEHIEMVIRMLVLLVLVGLLSISSIIVRLIRKKQWNPLVLITFGLALFLFFSSTSLARVKFELNTTEQTEVQE